eukprot:m.255343 g.255343  ORF g.255343 m.255343 type:complete len:305 (+) comp15946_c1_seq1:142-1056(+)
MGGAAPTWTVRSTGTARTVSATVAHAVPNCSVLAFAEPRLREAYQGFGTDISSWGGSVAYDPTDGLFHMFVAEMANHCGLETWHPNSRVVHATSPTAEGPYTRVQVVLGHYAHGPSVARDPITGTWVLTHLGTGLPDPTSRPIPGVAGVTLHYCVNGNSYNTSIKSYPTIPGLPPPPPPPPPPPRVASSISWAHNRQRCVVDPVVVCHTEETEADSYEGVDGNGRISLGSARQPNVVDGSGDTSRGNEHVAANAERAGHLRGRIGRQAKRTAAPSNVDSSNRQPTEQSDRDTPCETRKPAIVNG